MNNIVDTLKCGTVYKHSKNAVVLTVSKFEDINNKLIPLFNKHKIEGVKALDFGDFKKVAELINKKAHLTFEGLKLIQEIKSRMNNNRKHI